MPCYTTVWKILTIIVGRILRPPRWNEDSFEQQMSEELDRRESSLAWDLEYRESESEPEAKLFAAMLCLGLWYGHFI